MAPKLYMTIASPPVRAVMLTAEEIGLKLEYVNVDLATGQHKTPEYLKKNPQHTVPMLEDGDFILWDSHAIAAYLVTVYAKDDSLYPKDPQKRGLVDQRLHFNSSILFSKARDIVSLAMRFNELDIPQRKIADIVEAYSFLEAFLENRKWLAGDHLTIADLCCSATLSTLRNIIPVDSEKFPRVIAWFNQCSALPYFEKVSAKGVDIIKQAFKFNLKSE